LVRRLENEVASSLATVRRHDDNPRSSGRALSAIDRTSA
jgi:hypothetical protein